MGASTLKKRVPVRKLDGPHMGYFGLHLAPWVPPLQVGALSFLLRVALACWLGYAQCSTRLCDPGALSAASIVACHGEAHGAWPELTFAKFVLHSASSSFTCSDGCSFAR